MGREKKDAREGHWMHGRRAVYLYLQLVTRQLELKNNSKWFYWYLIFQLFFFSHKDVNIE